MPSLAWCVCPCVGYACKKDSHKFRVHRWPHIVCFGVFYMLGEFPGSKMTIKVCVGFLPSQLISVLNAPSNLMLPVDPRNPYSSVGNQMAPSFENQKGRGWLPTIQATEIHWDFCGQCSYQKRIRKLPATHDSHAVLVLDP